MPQPPLLIDQLQIEPGSGQTLIMRRDAGTGGFFFTDPTLPDGVRLHELAGLRSIDNVLVVGKSGAGAAYQTIQAALDAVPAGSSSLNPHFILVMPGRYDETVTIARDGVRLVGLGMPEIRSVLEETPNAPGNDHTIRIANTLGTPPLSCLIQGFTIKNAHNTKACLRVEGGAGSTVLRTGLHLKDCTLWANGNGNLSLWATTAGKVEATGCRFEGSALGSLLMQEMTQVGLSGCYIGHGLNLRSNDADLQPVDGAAVEVLTMQHCTFSPHVALVPAVAIDCDGTGGSRMHACAMGLDKVIQFSGDQEHIVSSSTLGILSVLETPDLHLPGTTIESLNAPNAAATLDLDSQRGVLVFNNEASKALTFDIPGSNGDYTVALEVNARPANDETPWVTLKDESGFTVNFHSLQTLTVTWSIRRR